MTNHNVQIFNADTIDQLPWEECRDYKEIQKVLSKLIKNGSEYYFSNVKTTLSALHIDDLVLPLTINNNSYENSYVCSPYNHFIGYGLQEMKQPLYKGTLLALGKLLQWGEIDKIICVNNWLVPTNLYPKFTLDQIQSVTQALIERYPQHAIVFRNINPVHPMGLKDHLHQVGYTFVPCRMIYYTDSNDPQPFQSRMYKSDLKIMNKSPYSAHAISEASPETVSRIRELYESLNIEKYSALNPDYTDNFIDLMLKSGWFSFKLFEKNGAVDGVLGYFVFRDVMTSPFFGYDTSLSQDLGIYRQISTQLLLDAKEKGLLLHQSSGAGHYKMLRRAKSAIESMAVYHAHLPLRRRLPWKVLGALMNSIGKHYL